MADEVQPSPRTNKLNRWVGWCVVLAVLGMVALWGGFVLAHIPREAALPPWRTKALQVRAARTRVGRRSEPSYFSMDCINGLPICKQAYDDELCGQQGVTHDDDSQGG